MITYTVIPLIDMDGSNQKEQFYGLSLGTKGQATKMLYDKVEKDMAYGDLLTCCLSLFTSSCKQHPRITDREKKQDVPSHLECLLRVDLCCFYIMLLNAPLTHKRNTHTQMLLVVYVGVFLLLLKSWRLSVTFPMNAISSSRARYSLLVVTSTDGSYNRHF